MILMAGSTFAIGLIPSYLDRHRRAHPARRLPPGPRLFHRRGVRRRHTFIAEYSPDKRRGFLASFLEFGTLAGYAAAPAWSR